jgi:hypothetical protein
MHHVRRCKLFAILTLLTAALIVQGAHPAQAESSKTSNPSGSSGLAR